jgi:hypothetical protein
VLVVERAHESLFERAGIRFAAHSSYTHAGIRWFTEGTEWV